MGWETALQSVDRGATDVAALRGPRAEGLVAELLPPAAAGFFTAQRVAPGGGAVDLRQGFAVVIVVDGSGSLGGLDVQRGDALLVPHAAGSLSAEGDFTAIVSRPPEAVA
jgi:mannose-6-phosphate isomerase